jgi:LAS superfamily LD-carboxypeptidase LdcB
MIQVPLLTDALLTGRDDTFIDHQYLERPVHRAVIEAWQQLASAARAAGFDPVIASGFRNYQRQLQIWNAKASGERELLDTVGQPLDRRDLSEWEFVQAILRWSALPGASRHHWGTDIDVYDRAAVAEDYTVQLTPAEVADDGPFGAFHRWLDQRIANGESYGFFRPYAEDCGGIAPERWHLSYAPMALYYQRQLTPERLWTALDAPGLVLRNCVQEHWSEIFSRFIWVAPELYPVECRARFVPVAASGVATP